MKTRTVERICSSRLVRAFMAFALALSFVVAVPEEAIAANSERPDTVKVVIGDFIKYAGWDTSKKTADGNEAYCIDPTTISPGSGTYSTAEADELLTAAMWFSFGAPGFDESMWPETYYDGSSWTDDKYRVVSHILLSYVNLGDADKATYGTTDSSFKSWAKTEIIGSVLTQVKQRVNEVSTGFTAFKIVDTGAQDLVSFSWETGGVKIAKVDAEVGTSEQGDATLEGAEFAIINASGENAFVSGKSYANGETVMTITTSWDGSAYVAQTASDALPLGTYEIVEVSAPEGYLISQESITVNIESDGQVVDLTSTPIEDEVVRGGVQVTKADAELKTSEALGGNGDGKGVGSTLSGIEFTITNASQSAVLVDGESYEPGETITTITTSWDADTEAYIAKTAADALPYGTYEIQESATNNTYLLTDGESKTFEVREDGMLITADTNGGELTFYNQVVRNDLKISKKASDTNEGLQVPFAITNVSTGETHVLVTDRNGQGSTESSWNLHSSNTNGNDHLLELDTITADDMDTEAGIWFGLGEDGSEASVNDALGALPYGQYTLTELRCEANEGYSLITKTFWVERDSASDEVIWMAIDNNPSEKIRTQASDASDGDKIVQASESVTIVDTVYYENLESGETYTLTGTLMVKSTGEPLLDAENNPISATKEFTANATSGSVDIEFTFDASLLAGESIVVFESLVKDGIEVAVHADIDDEGQTVSFLNISSQATDASDGDKLVTGTEASITDEVAYEGLTSGEVYTLSGTLIDAESGEPVSDAEGNPVSASVEFSAEEASGTLTNVFTFDASDLGGRRLVVFERLLDSEGTVLAIDENLLNEDQSVTVAEIGTTLTDASDGDHVIENATVSLVDVVEYKGLTVGETYTINGTLMVKSTGEPLVDAQGNSVTATTEFTAEVSAGSVEVTFIFDASQLEEGAALVAFEEVLDASGNLVAEHKDLEDEGQTVVVDDPETPETPEAPETPEDSGTTVNSNSGDSTQTFPKTGDDSPIALLSVLALISALVAGGAGCALYKSRKGRRHLLRT